MRHVRRLLAVTLLCFALAIGGCASGKPAGDWGKVEVAVAPPSRVVRCPKASARQLAVLNARVAAPPAGHDVTLRTMQGKVDELRADSTAKGRVGLQLARELDKCAGR